MALSSIATEPAHWDTAEHVAHLAVTWMVSHGPSDAVVNVNIPDVPLADLAGIVPASLARYGAVQAEIGDRGEDFVTVRFDEIRAEDDDSDASLLARHWATVTALRPPSEVDGVDLSTMGA